MRMMISGYIPMRESLFRDGWVCLNGVQRRASSLSSSCFIGMPMGGLISVAGFTLASITCKLSKQAWAIILAIHADRHAPGQYLAADPAQDANNEMDEAFRHRDASAYTQQAVGGTAI